MSTARERVQQEADARYPLTPNVWEDQHNRERRGGFVAGRTVSAEQIEQVALRLYLASDGKHPWIALADGERQAYRGWAGDLLTAAGFLVEEDR